MNPIKALKLTVFISLLLLVNNFSFALNSDQHKNAWLLVINNKLLRCVETSYPRFRLCEGYYQGLLDLEPREHEKYDFMPLLYSSKGIELDLKISRMIEEKGRIITSKAPGVFSNLDYLSLKRKEITLDLKNVKLDRASLSEIREITDNIYNFFKLLKKYKNDIKHLAIVQNIICKNGFISSFFAIPDFSQKKDSNQPIISSGIETFSEDQRNFYENMISFGGHEPKLEEARNLFQVIRARPDIPFDYTTDGCFARAHVIAHALFENGYHTGKIWIAGTLINPHDPDREWEYHVAALIYIEDGPHVKPFVIDPSPCNKQLQSVSEWLSLHGLKHTPKLVSFPLPKQSDYFEDVVLSYSSHLPLWPFDIYLEESFEENLDEAQEENAINLALLLKGKTE